MGTIDFVAMRWGGVTNRQVCVLVHACVCATAYVRVFIWMCVYQHLCTYVCVCFAGECPLLVQICMLKHVRA